MNRFIFWQRWLFITSILFALFGIVFAYFGDSAFLDTYNHALAQNFYGADQFPDVAEPYRDFSYGPVGGCIFCCYALLAFIAWYPFRRKEKWAWWAICIAFTGWVIMDSSACIRHGFYFQIYAVNVVSILVKALPLAFTWREFFGRGSDT
jgi:hypothetical protein